MIGTTLSHFKITAKLGEGGMGEVYRADDTKLGREVAVKVLPEAVAADPERLARFEREAKVLASLNHPNIAAIYSFERAGASPAPTNAVTDVGEGLAPSREEDPLSPGAPKPPRPGVPSPQAPTPQGPIIHFLVMELVEGEDLNERIERGPVPIEEAMPVGLQISQALEAAHEIGIIHRDLKPGNIKVTPDGKVKVLDFGLAKALDPQDPTTPGPLDLSMSPTLTAQMTQAGVLLGTAAYMSPEQASGEPADKRADIWAFGVVLAEMLTGRQQFDGKTTSHVLAAVLKEEPDWTRLEATTPPRVVDLLQHCLRKEPTQRLQSIGDARILIQDYLEDPTLFEASKGAPASTPVAAWKQVLPWALFALTADVSLRTDLSCLGSESRNPPAGRGRLLFVCLEPGPCCGVTGWYEARILGSG
jgi:serine/threonine protein kinase